MSISDDVVEDMTNRCHSDVDVDMGSCFKFYLGAQHQQTRFQQYLRHILHLHQLKKNNDCLVTKQGYGSCLWTISVRFSISVRRELGNGRTDSRQSRVAFTVIVSECCNKI